uniref:Uncharacterized protein n=1 Tax=Strigamia maritima TaxID=126957 RepID=T1IZH0_STRMM
MKQTILIFLGIIHIVLSIPLPEQSQSLSGGTYNFAYDTNTGGFHSQSGSASGTSGKYGFNTADGKLNVQFSAGSGGGGGGGEPASTYSAYNGANGGGSGTYSLNLNPDGSYSYNYDLNDQGKSESRQPDGEVVGKFHFTGKDGQRKSIEYTAGRGGFQPVGDHIPKADDNGANGAPSAYSAFGGNGNGDMGSMSLNLQPGGDYSYSYALKDQSKSESGSGGKVKGQFSFVAPDGKNRAIKYTADENGFLAEGDHLPKSVEPLSINGGNDGSYYSAPLDAGARPGSYSFDYMAKAHGRSEQGNSGDIKGDYSVMSLGGNQKSSYTAGKDGFIPIHDIMINLG